VENRKIWDHTTKAHPHPVLGPRCLSSLYEGSSALSALLTPSPPTVFLDPAAQLTDVLLETMDDLCRCEAVNPLQMYFFSYILYYSCTGKPQFSYWGSYPWRIAGLKENVKCSQDNGSFLLFLQIVIQRRSWASSLGSQRTRILELPIPARLFTPHQTEAGDWKES
jgi:hypothetical protein